MTNKWRRRFEQNSGLREPWEDAPMLTISTPSPGQSYPRHYPGAANAASDPLGAPMTIQETAQLIGCSAWAIRQNHLRQGLPCFRSGPGGKFIFYRAQVIAWVLSRQNT